jgi:hypothetical protein
MAPQAATVDREGMDEDPCHNLDKFPVVATPFMGRTEHLDLMVVSGSSRHFF